MKHHFADYLDRSGGHWSITPNRERWANHFEDVSDASPDVTRITLTGATKNWNLAASLPQLRELTLHQPNQAQLQWIEGLRQLQALRITHAKPKHLLFVESLQNLRELVLEYVSGFSDISPLGRLPNLTAVHLENLRNVDDFSSLAASQSLKYLSIDGTLDWSQPVRSLDFLGSIRTLEYLRLMGVRVPVGGNPLAGLSTLPNIRKLNLSRTAFTLDVYAWLEAKLSNVEGTRLAPFVRFGSEDREVDRRDIRSRLPLEEFLQLTGAYLAPDGTRYLRVPAQAVLLGKGERFVTGKESRVAAKCQAHEERYRSLVTSALEPE